MWAEATADLSNRYQQLAAAGWVCPGQWHSSCLLPSDYEQYLGSNLLKKWRLNDPRIQDMSVIKCYQHLPATICCLLQWITCAQSNPSSIIWLQGMDGVKCFSIYPSKMQTDPEDVSSVSRSWKLFFFTPKKAPNGWVSKYLEGELCQVNSQWTLDFSSIYVLQAQSNRSSSVTSLFGRACQDDDTFRVFKINHDIPICESVSPNSSYRWHSMDDKEYQAYLNRLEAEKPSWIV